MAESRTLPDTSGRPWVLTKISRRSRLHPGTRYLARGLNEQYSAGNEIECEQLVWDLPSVPQDPVRWSRYESPPQLALHHFSRRFTPASLIIYTYPDAVARALPLQLCVAPRKCANLVGGRD